MLANDLHDETTFSFSNQPPQPEAAERRQSSRHLTILRVGALIGPEGRELCLIRNISAGGIMAHVYSHHASGEAVAVELNTNQQVAGKVIWVNGSNIGIQFDSPVDVAEMLSTQAVLDNGWRPRLPRIEVDRLATLRCGARVHGVNTRDISQGGVKVETDEPLEVGREIVLTLDKLTPVHGVVRWCAGGMAGISFNQLIPFGELMTWLKGNAAA